MAVFPRLYNCPDSDLPTGTEPDALVVVWDYDESTMTWKWFKPGWPESTLETLVNGTIYLTIVTEACSWPIPY
jgi:hypothetical protein